jgi:hypothetical protein
MLLAQQNGHPGKEGFRQAMHDLQDVLYQD